MKDKRIEILQDKVELYKKCNLIKFFQIIKILFLKKKIFINLNLS